MANSTASIPHILYPKSETKLSLFRSLKSFFSPQNSWTIEQGDRGKREQHLMRVHRMMFSSLLMGLKPSVKLMWCVLIFECRCTRLQRTVDNIDRWHFETKHIHYVHCTLYTDHKCTMQRETSKWIYFMGQ